MSAANLLGKKKVVVIIVAIIAAGAVSAVLVASSSVAQANAQQQKMKMWWDGTGQGIPAIKGSVSVANKTSDFIGENVKVQLATAAEAAQNQTMAGTVLGGHLGVVEGYLVYTFFVADIADHAGKLVIVDAGNGQVLYTSQSHALGSFGPMMHGQWGGHNGYGVQGGGWWWGGPWKGHGLGWGAWH